VFVFDNYPEAVRAELDITLQATYAGEYFEKAYSLKSTRKNQGYFQFTLSAISPQGLGAEGYALQIFSLLSGYGGRSLPDAAIPATVRLYDKDDQLICAHTLEIVSVVEQAHRNQDG
jgi:hypothetical protein